MTEDDIVLCKLSASRAACPGSRPWTLFQYWLEAMSMPEMMKNLFSSSKVADSPPRRAVTPAVPTLMVLSKGVLRNSRVKKAASVALAEAKTGLPTTRPSQASDFFGRSQPRCPPL